MALRCVYSVIAVYFIMISLQALPLVVFLLIMNCDSFFTAIFQYFVLKKPLKVFEIVAMVGCYTGIVIIVYGTP